MHKKRRGWLGSASIEALAWARKFVPLGTPRRNPM
jgi:hypothetical protein